MSTTATLETVSEQSLEQSSEQSLEIASDQSVDIQELSIVVVAKGTNPNLLNPDFFVYSGIIPREWQLARPIVANPQVTQLIFQNGISVVVELDKVTFSESVNPTSLDDMTIADMATKLIAALPAAEYQAIGINPKRIISFNPDEQPGSAQQYLTETLLAPGEWQQFGQEPMQASLNLFYTLDDCRFQLSINPTQLRLSNDTEASGILFSGNFHYDLASANPGDRPQQIQKALSNWQEQLATYRSLLETKFMLKV